MKNPLYVVKGQQVEAASGWLDLLVKKLELGPLLAQLQAVFTFMLEQVKSYPLFVMVKAWFDQMLARLAPLMAMVA